MGSISGFRRLKFCKHCNGNRDIRNRKVPKEKMICVGHGGINEWIGGALLTQSQIPLTVSEFRGVKS
jgi:hypothetical protein